MKIHRTAIIPIILLLATAIFTACEPEGYLYTADGEVECGGDGKPIVLTNNPDVANPTYERLLAFIKSDPTDARDYIEHGPDGYVCADFAETLHNNAEAAGIRAAWVGIMFINDTEGHAVNAFETTDQGLVYVDCTSVKSAGTGGGVHTAAAILDGDENDRPKSRDTIAYIEIGAEYGIIPIDYAKSLDYDYYVEYQQQWDELDKLVDEYNQAVARFNSEVEGKVFISGSVEARIMKSWEKDLEEKEAEIIRLEEELGTYRYYISETPQIVHDVMVHW